MPEPRCWEHETCVATPSGHDRIATAGPGGQSVSQCNDSGGAGGTLTCTVTAPPTRSTGLPTTINQCEGSGRTGASTVTCTATITNNFMESTEPVVVVPPVVVPPVGEPVVVPPAVVPPAAVPAVVVPPAVVPVAVAPVVVPPAVVLPLESAPGEPCRR